MKTLDQVLGVESKTRASAESQQTAQYHLLQKEPLLTGVSRTYRKLDEDGEQLPPEFKPVESRVSEILKEVAKVMSPWFDITLAKESANQVAKADVEVDGQVILKDAPATYLLWLEKRLADFHTVIVKIPVLPQTDNWTFDSAQNCYKTEVVETSRSKKTPRVLVKSQATPQHPAQTEVYHEDVVVGYYATTKFSGALPRTVAQTLRNRIEKLQAAVLTARKKANLAPAPEVSVGAAIYEYLLSDL